MAKRSQLKGQSFRTSGRCVGLFVYLFLCLHYFSGSAGPEQHRRQNLDITFQTWTSPSIALIFISSTPTSISHFCTGQPSINLSKNVFTLRTTASHRYSCLYALLGPDIPIVLKFGWTVSIVIIRQVGNGLSRCK